MAIWQYTFHVLPKNGFDARSSVYPLKMDVNEFDDEPYWKVETITRDFFGSIKKILPLNKSWSSQIDLYGNQESNCFEVFFENEHVFSASFRIDFTSDYGSILSQIIEFSILNGLIILDEGLNIVPLNFESANSSIKNSCQVKKYRDLCDNQNDK